MSACPIADRLGQSLEREGAGHRITASQTALDWKGP